MDIEKAKDILLNVIADEVIGTYCIEIQKEVDCSKNCENEDCYLIQAIETVLSELEKKDKEIEELKSMELKAKHGIVSITLEGLINLENEIKKRDKIIELMANKLVEAHGWFYSEFDNFSKEDFIKYFTNKATDNVGE